LKNKNRDRMTGFHDPMRQKTARAGLNTMMKCRAENNRSRALSTLSYRYMSADQTKSLDKIFNRIEYDDPCSLAKDIRYSISTGPVVGAFSEFFLLRRYKDEDIAALSSLADEDWQLEMMKPRNANELFGQCVARSGGTKIYALIETIPDTDAESAVIKDIVPLLGPCVTDGIEVKFDKTSLRAVLAYGLFRTVHQHHELLEARN